MDGILYEPRLKCQLFDFSAADQVSPLGSDSATFLNAEQYPVRITHVAACIRNQGPDAPEGVSSDPRLVQRIGLRMRSHDTFYMNDEFVRLPLWGTQVVAGANPISRSVSSWTFHFGPRGSDGARAGVFMGSKDNFKVEVALEFPIDADTEVSMDVWATFHGVGALSRRPKQITGIYTFTAADGTKPRSLGANQAFLNDGTEPLEITKMTIHCGAPNGTAGTNPVGDIRRLRVSVKQNGNGTNQRWTTTPAIMTNPPTLDLASCVPAALWGLTTGQAIVHRLPDNSDNYPGWLWFPNEGMTLDVQPATGVRCAVYIALIGHIVVK